MMNGSTKSLIHKAANWVLFAALVVSFCSFALAADSELPYRKLMDADKYDQAEAMLRRLVRSNRVDKDQKWILIVDLAKVQRLRGATKTALKTLEELSEKDRDRSRASLEFARCQLTTEDTDLALQLLRLLQNDSDPEIKCQANYVVARHHFKHDRFQETISLCNLVASDFSAIDFYHNPNEVELRRLLTDARKLHSEAELGLISQLYGEDYARYRRARYAQARGDYEEAIQHYRQIDGSILTDAARCYIPQCLEGLGLLPEAVKGYDEFIRSNPNGLYRGEAMLRLSKLRLLNAGGMNDLEKVIEQIKHLEDWFEEVERQQAMLSEDSVNAIVRDFPVPETFTSKNVMGNHYRNFATPNTIVNRLTCRWYVPRMRIEAMLLYGFVLNEMGRLEESRNALSHVIEFNRTHGGYMLNHGGLPHRLVWESRDGAFFLSPREWKAVSKQHGVALHLAYFYLVSGEMDHAKKLFDRVMEKTEGHKAFLNDRASAELGLAVIDFRKYREDAAVERLETFDTAYRGTSLLPLAKIIAANIYAGREDGYESATENYQFVVKHFSNTEHAPRALLSLAVCAWNRNDPETTSEACEHLLSSFADSRFTPSGRTLSGNLNTASLRVDNNGGSQGRHQSDGRVLRFSRHMVIPGDSGAAYDFDSVNVGDIIAYDLSYAVRSGCRINYFRLWLTALEPQIVPTSYEKHIEFLRIPVLIRE